MKSFIKLMALALVAVMTVACFAACGTPADDTKVYKIASDNAFAPFEYLDVATNTYVGVDMDIMAAIAADQGFSYTMANVGFDAALGQVQAGQADAVIAGMTIKPERAEIFDFSEGYFMDGQI
ncbi:MAG: transporter substrate-binding domain-containing protein, partial [Clostridia bacterium]|nr:transporter substrate-binding domain-containing protein [Clostridia bacterium]